jgi:hypothetical protein
MRNNRVSKIQMPKSPLAAPPRHVFPAWIDASAGLTFVSLVTPRVRDALVLRLVAPVKPGRGRSASDAPRVR